MNYQALTILGVATLAACSKQATDTLPPFPRIEEALLAYANCLDASGRKLAVPPDGAETLAQEVVTNCRGLRRRALALKVVPVMFSTVAEFDTFHFGFARRAIEKYRAKR